MLKNQIAIVVAAIALFTSYAQAGNDFSTPNAGVVVAKPVFDNLAPTITPGDFSFNMILPVTRQITIPQAGPSLQIKSETSKLQKVDFTLDWQKPKQATGFQPVSIQFAQRALRSI